MILHCKGDPAAAVGGLVPRAAEQLFTPYSEGQQVLSDACAAKKGYRPGYTGQLSSYVLMSIEGKS
jgi:hypothetical protein